MWAAGTLHSASSPQHKGGEEEKEVAEVEDEGVEKMEVKGRRR